MRPDIACILTARNVKYGLFANSTQGIFRAKIANNAQAM